MKIDEIEKYYDLALKEEWSGGLPPEMIRRLLKVVKAAKTLDQNMTVCKSGTYQNIFECEESDVIALENAIRYLEVLK